MQVQRGDDRQYFESFEPKNDGGANFNITSQALGSGLDIAQQAQKTKLASFQVEANTKAMRLSDEINTKYQADPTSQEREKEFSEGLKGIFAGYEVPQISKGDWDGITQGIQNNYKTYNDEWSMKQQKTNTQVDLKNTYSQLINNAAEYGANGSDLGKVKLEFANGLDALKSSGNAVLGEVVTGEYLKDATHDFMTSYVAGIIDKNPAMALHLLKDKGVLDDIDNQETIEKLRQSAGVKMQQFNQDFAVQKVSDLIVQKGDMGIKIMEGTLSTAELQQVTQNLKPNERDLIFKMAGYGTGQKFSVDRETGEIQYPEVEEPATDADYNDPYNFLSVGDKTWTFVDDKGKRRNPNAIEQSEMTTELFVAGSRLLNSVDGATPQESLQKVAEYQNTLNKATLFGLNKEDYQKMMNDFVLPATKGVQADAKNYKAGGAWFGTGDKYGYDAISNFFTPAKDAKEGDIKNLSRQEQLAGSYYWAGLQRQAQQRGMSIEGLKKMSKDEQRKIYHQEAQRAIEQAKSTTDSPQTWFKQLEPNYVYGISQMLPSHNADSVINRVSSKILALPSGASREEIDKIVEKEIGNEYATMRQRNSSTVNTALRTSKYDYLIQKHAQKNGVDADFIRTIIKHESNFNANAHSPAGAMGLMQLMPSTAASMGISKPLNPEQNVDAGVRLITSLLKSYNGDKRLALAAYNAGSGAVKKYKGIPPYGETRNYVNNIMADYEDLKKSKYLPAGSTSKKVVAQKGQPQQVGKWQVTRI